MSKDSKRRDAKGRVLKSGESQRKDGTYQFRYTQNGKREYVYAPTLKALRLKEDEIHRQLLLYGTPKTADGITLLDAVLKCVSFKNNCNILRYLIIFGLYITSFTLYTVKNASGSVFTMKFINLEYSFLSTIAIISLRFELS